MLNIAIKRLVFETYMCVNSKYFFSKKAKKELLTFKLSNLENCRHCIINNPEIKIEISRILDFSANQFCNYRKGVLASFCKKDVNANRLEVQAMSFDVFCRRFELDFNAT